jgi:hypothetical protein
VEKSSTLFIRVYPRPSAVQIVLFLSPAFLFVADNLSLFFASLREILMLISENVRNLWIKLLPNLRIPNLFRLYDIFINKNVVARIASLWFNCPVDSGKGSPPGEPTWLVGPNAAAFNRTNKEQQQKNDRSESRFPVTGEITPKCTRQT